MTHRTPAGRFAPGTSGNPTGRPPLPEEIRTRIRDYTDQAIDVLVKAMSHEDPRVAVLAAKEMLDRGWGKAPTTSDVTLRQQEIDPSAAHLEALRSLMRRRNADDDGEASSH